MAKVQRHLSIHFNTRFFKGITHEEILSGIEKKVELDNVGSVQFTETDCIISVKDLNTKEKLISGGITLKNRSVNFLDVEKTITNVTIKDAPYGVSDCYIATQMMKYREVIPGSVCLFVCLMVFSATLNNISVISWRSVLFVEDQYVEGTLKIQI